MWGTDQLRTNPNEQVLSTTVYFPNAVFNPSFTIHNIGSARNGNWAEKVTVWYAYDSSNEVEYGSMTWDELKDINAGKMNKDRNDWVVKIEDYGITSIRV